MVHSPGREGSAKSALLIAAVLVPPAVLYVLTLFPGVGGEINPGDSAKFQFLGKILGVPHDPGYPQYMMLNHLWTRLPTPLELATHVNLLSAMFTLVAGGLIFPALRRLSGSGITAALGTWTLLFSSAVWTISTEAEVYSLHLAYVGGVLWAGVRWWETRQRFWLVVLIGIVAFSLGHHPLSVTFLPAVLFAVVGRDVRALRSVRVIGAAAVLAGLSVSQYAYLWWRSHVSTVPLDGLPRNATFWDVLDKMLSGRFSGRFLFLGGLDAVLERGQVLSGEFLQLTQPALILAAIGVFVLMRRDKILGGFVALLGIGSTAFVLAYQIGDWGGYVPPIWTATVAFAAVGAATPRTVTVRAGLFTVWMVALIWLTASTFGTMYARTNRYDRSPLLEVAGSEAVVLTYVERGPRGYRERQLTNYYRLGLDALDQFGLTVMTVQHAFEGRRIYLRNRSIYFASDGVKEYVDRYRMAYVEKEVAGDPQYRYFVSAIGSGPESLRIEPVGTGGTRVSADGGELVTPTAPIQVIVMAAGDRRVKGVTAFEWGDNSEAQSHPATEFLDLVNPRDWIAIVWQGDQLGYHRPLLESMLTRAGMRVDVTPAPARSLVVVGQHSVPTGWRVLVDPGEPIDIALSVVVDDEPSESSVR